MIANLNWDNGYISKLRSEFIINFLKVFNELLQIVRETEEDTDERHQCLNEVAWYVSNFFLLNVFIFASPLVQLKNSKPQN